MVITEFDLGYNKGNIIEVACNGNLDAQETVAFQYLSNKSFFDDTPDWDIGMYWLKKASENGSIFATRCLDRIKKNPEDRTFGGIHPTANQLLINEDSST
jgi:hypothetical protein